MGQMATFDDDVSWGGGGVVGLGLGGRGVVGLGLGGGSIWIYN